MVWVLRFLSFKLVDNTPRVIMIANAANENFKEGAMLKEIVVITFVDSGLFSLHELK